MNITNLKFAITLLTATAIISCGNNENKVEFTQTVKVDTVSSTAQRNFSSFPGKVKAAEDVNLAFRVSGTILKNTKQEGQFVKKGEVIAEMDPRDYQLQLSATQAEYNQIKAEAERVMALYEKKSVTLSQYEQAKYGLEQITAKLNNHKNQLNDTKLRAPFDGYIQKYLYDENETVGAGYPVVSMITSGVPEIEINIPAVDFIKRDKIDSCVCYTGLYPGKKFKAQILGISQKANLNQLYEVRLALKNPGNISPAPGTTVMVDVNYKPEGESFAVIPITSVFENDGASCVWIVDENNTLHKRTIIINDINLKNEATVKEGLKPGEVVVSAGVNSVSEGQQVKILANKTTSNVGGLL